MEKLKDKRVKCMDCGQVKKTVYKMKHHELTEGTLKLDIDLVFCKLCLKARDRD